jgi:hypothetical protein
MEGTMIDIENMTVKQVRELASQLAPFVTPNQSPTVDAPAPHRYIGKYVVVRTYSAGVHVGTLYSVADSLSGKEAILTGCRRIYSWGGAFTLSAVADSGIKSGKMEVSLPEMAIENVIEIIPCTDEARLNLVGFPVHQP